MRFFKIFFLLTFVFLLFLYFFNINNYCLASKIKNNKKIYIYVTSSMHKYTKNAFDKYYGNISLVTGSSSELIHKAIRTKMCDFMILASEDFMNLAKSIDILKDCKKFIKQIPVVCINKDLSKNNLTLDKLLFSGNYILAVGNMNFTAIGKKYQQILTKIKKYNKNINFKDVIYTANISQTVSYVKIGVVDIGIIFNTTAKSSNIDYLNLPKEYNVFDTSYLVIPKCTSLDSDEIKDLEQYLFNVFINDIK